MEKPKGFDDGNKPKKKTENAISMYISGNEKRTKVGLNLTTKHTIDLGILLVKR